MLAEAATPQLVERDRAFAERLVPGADHRRPRPAAQERILQRKPAQVSGRVRRDAVLHAV